MPIKPPAFFLTALLLLLLSGCLPITFQTAIEPPNFSLQGQVEVIDFQVPIIGSGNLVLRLPIQVYNPNPIGLSLQRIDFDFFINHQQALSSTFSEGLQLAPQGSSSFVIDVTIPLLQGLGLVDDIIAMAEGRPTSFRLDGQVQAEIYQQIQVFARTTLISGSIN